MCILLRQLYEPTLNPEVPFSSDVAKKTRTGSAVHTASNKDPQKGASIWVVNLD